MCGTVVLPTNAGVDLIIHSTSSLFEFPDSSMGFFASRLLLNGYSNLHMALVVSSLHETLLAFCLLPARMVRREAGERKRGDPNLY